MSKIHDALQRYFVSGQPATPLPSIPPGAWIPRDSLPGGSVLLTRAFDLARLTARWAVHTERDYLQSIQNLIRHGVVSLEHVTKPTMGDFVEARLRSGVDAKTVNMDLSALASVLNELEKRGLADFELLEIVRGLRLKIRRPRARQAYHLSRQEVHHLLATARAVEPRAEFPMLVCVWSGVRIGELCRLRREDFSLGATLLLHIRERPELAAFGPDYGGVKNHRERDISVCEQLARAIVERAPESGFLFPPGRTKNPRGLKSQLPFLSIDALETDMRRVRAAAGLPKVTWTTLRHTRASWWAQAGVSRTKIAEWLGNTEEVCEAHYIGLFRGYDPDCEKAPPSPSGTPAPTQPLDKVQAIRVRPTKTDTAIVLNEGPARDDAMARAVSRRPGSPEALAFQGMTTRVRKA